VYAPAERADTLPVFLLYPFMYSVVNTRREKSKNCNVVLYNILKRKTVHLNAYVSILNLVVRIWNTEDLLEAQFLPKKEDKYKNMEHDNKTKKYYSTKRGSSA
jgi:hypothetical protein